MTDLDRKSHDMFIAAIEKPPSQWSAFLEEHCDSPELKLRVEKLLNAHMQSGEFLSDNAFDTYPKLAFPFGGQVEEFKIIRLIGKGGMGHVYLAEDTVLKRLVALKIVGLADFQADTNEQVLERFQREARAAARLIHPSVVQVHRTGEKDGICYIAMEYVKGQTLHEQLATVGDSARTNSSERYREVADLIAQIADAMDHAHRAGVIHRDIKPSNILIDGEGNARLADFGVAKITSEETLRQTGVIIGSCAYMSPEQAQVMKADVDHRTDIFSLGVVLYEAICLKRPFDGGCFDELLKALSDCHPVPLKKIAKDVPTDLVIICNKAMEKEVSHRYQSAAHFYADLRCFVEGRPILASPPNIRRRARHWLQRHRGRAVAASVILLASAIIGLVFAYQSEQQARLAAEQSQMGRLEISARHHGAKVSVALFNEDLTWGEPRQIGEAPLSVYLEPGLYRVSIRHPKLTLEASSLMDAGVTDVVEVNEPPKRLVASLVDIVGNNYRVGLQNSTYLPTMARDITLLSFRISPTEVSNLEYREYVEAVGAEQPSTWDSPYDTSIDQLPVSGISWDQANRYCRWRGVRLPTPFEWEVAAQGSSGAKFPWGDQPNERIKRKESTNLQASAYREFASPVNSSPELATPQGVKHMLSNVQEYTEGIVTDRNQGLVTRRGLIVKGRSWRDDPIFSSADMFTLSVRNKGAFNRGFRIAISIEN